MWQIVLQKYQMFFFPKVIAAVFDKRSLEMCFFPTEELRISVMEFIVWKTCYFLSVQIQQSLSNQHVLNSKQLSKYHYHNMSIKLHYALNLCDLQSQSKMEHGMTEEHAGGRQGGEAACLTVMWKSI